MFRFLRKHKKIVLVSLTVIAVALPFFGIGTNYLMSSPHDVVLKVNGEKVMQSEFDRVYNQMLRQKGEVKGDEKKQLQNQALSELIRLIVFDQEAKKFGLHISDQELQLQLASIPAFQKEGHFDPQTYVQTIGQTLGTTPAEFEKIRKKEMAASKLNQLIASTVHISDSQLNEALPGRIALETDKKKKKELQENKEILRTEMRNKEANLVFADWLNQMNSSLRVDIVSNRFRRTLNGAPQ